MSPIVALYLSWALTAAWPVTARIANGYCDPLWFGAAQLAVGLCVMGTYLVATGRWRRIFAPDVRLPFFVIGCLGSGLTTGLMQTAVRFTTASNAAIVCQVEVVYSALLSAWLLGERISAPQAAASTLVLAGTTLIMGADLGTAHWKGDLIVLATPWMYQVSHIFSKRLPPDIEPTTIAGARMFWGLVTLAPIALLLGRPTFTPGVPLAALLVFHGLVLNTLTMPLWYMAVRKLELSKTTAIMLSYPALTVLYCGVLRLETIGWHQLAGLALSMSGALWLTRLVQASRAAAAPVEAVPA